ncbi:ubiquitin-conjugating enzyme E2 [Aspergillus glaucus CBS 516.65]|uniref:Ubiquitin-conjugating enzyme E2 Z n=1 Tax=Aspergillus glaucus CBS 516.65 TaxID=1160497 RepID=A0A1L9VKW0_ASPGL|nr:hypothetical protein ASPGLDRAFT_35034 [Aspergillus glaucus CBS 516.65]OJJ84534.1 hypothetical protein ASPGLDRAFT_35034 [Aspergillus glaucus CBS 516.65]
MANQSILRISREIKQLQSSTDLSLAISCDDQDLRKVRALILGPPETPYQFGFFEFSITFGTDYPAGPPTVQALTTNQGQCRFNPNIYACGKVCLSILGTWRGNRGEEWSSAQGLESVLISIQSLMSSNPYENEPGYESTASRQDKEDMMAYAAKIRHESIRISVIEPLECLLGIKANSTINPTDQEENQDVDEGTCITDAFADLRKRRFLWYYDCYMQSIAQGESEVTRKRRFTRMPFEHPGNSMDGHFDYPKLRSRLNQVKDAINVETNDWAVQGKAAQEQEAGIAANLKRQHEQIVEKYKKHKNFIVDFNMVDDNPFLWQLTYFGRPMTHLDGGIFNIKIHLSPSFPEDQPRVFVESPLFHYRVAKCGILCYFPARTDDMRCHVDAIVAALEEESPYDPRTNVHPEASRLFWGSPDDRKQYNRQLRRSVERSAECAYE